MVPAISPEHHPAHSRCSVSVAQICTSLELQFQRLSGPSLLQEPGKSWGPSLQHLCSQSHHSLWVLEIPQTPWGQPRRLQAKKLLTGRSQKWPEGQSDTSAACTQPQPALALPSEPQILLCTNWGTPPPHTHPIFRQK